jgi:hypothetical protein
MTGRKYWTTRDEINFIKNLGMGKHRKPPTASREKLLEGYLKGAKLRKNWGDMDPVEVLAFAATAYHYV